MKVNHAGEMRLLTDYRITSGVFPLIYAHRTPYV